MKALELPGGMTLEQQLAVLREGYTNGINDILDACMAQMLLPQHQEALADDAAQFLLFILAIKVVANNRQEPTLRNLMQAFRRLNKRIEREVPGMLMNYVRAVEEQARAEAAEASDGSD